MILHSFIKSVRKNGVKDSWQKVKTKLHKWSLDLPTKINYMKISFSDKLKKRATPGSVNFLNYKLWYQDFHPFYWEYRLIFRDKIYHFNSLKDNPVIIDGGGYIGCSTLYFKYAYPKAQVTVFEPHPENLKLLQRNLASNALFDVNVVPLGLDGKEGEQSFSDNGDGARIENNGSLKLKFDRLSKYINSDIDFLKLNIEGAELGVLQDLEESGKLKHVPEMVIEWHSFAHRPQNLGEGLKILERNGFKYAINHFNYQANPLLRPPFSLTPKSQFYLLVYAKRI